MILTRDSVVNAIQCEVTAPTGFTEMQYGGAVFDPKRRLVVETSRAQSNGKDVFVTCLNEDGTGSLLDDHPITLPFCTSTKPVFDNEKFVYFATCSWSSTGFCRLDLDTLNVESLSPSPFPLKNSSGLFLNGKIHFFNIRTLDRRDVIVVFDCETGTWSTREEIPDFYDSLMVVHPQDPGKMIAIWNCGDVKVVDVESFRIRTYTPRERIVDNDLISDFVAVKAPDNEFFLLACDCDSGVWKVFSSKENEWMDVRWETTSQFTQSAFIDPATHRLLFHINGTAHWSAVQFKIQ